MKFTKMHGLGNDFIFVEDFDEELIKEETKIAAKVCNRHFGVGADGLVLIRKSSIADMKMVIINSDGSRANMCGNAIRCFAKYIYDKGFVDKFEFTIETGDGVKKVRIIEENGEITKARVNMGKPNYDGKDIPLKDGINKLINEEVLIGEKKYRLTTVLVGVPHTVIVKDNKEFDINEGSKIEKYELFKEGTNVNFVDVIDRNNINVSTWERGAGATLACGTGMCSSAEVLNKLGFVDENVYVNSLGGTLFVEIKEEGIYMTGNAQYICIGEIL